MIKMAGLGDNVVDINYDTKTMYPGGNSLNFAVYGKQLGNDTAYIGVLGTDNEAAMIKRVLTELEIDISKCSYAEGETGKCAVRLENGERTIAEENDAGVVKSNPFQVTDEILEYLKGFDIVHSSCFSHIEDQLIKIKKEGIPVLYDFSDTWVEYTLDSICPKINIAFFSGTDLPDSVLRRLLRKAVDVHGCDLAVTTIGSRGAIVYNGQRFYKKKPYNFEGGAVDTTGAGDSWITAFIASYIENKKILKLLKKDNADNFIRKVDRQNFEDHLIAISMCAGNLLARKSCLVEGAFGHGLKFI